MLQNSSGPVRFGSFQLDLRTAELRCDQTPIKLQPQPAKILVLLVSRAGELVSREELADEVWGAETFVDFEQGLNFAIRQIRTALEDERGHPRYIETVPKRGYRFIAHVETAAKQDPVIAPHPVSALEPKAAWVESESSPPIPVSSPAHARVLQSRTVIFLAICVLTIGLVFAIKRLQRWEGERQKSGGHRIEFLAVLPLHNLSGDPEQEYFSDGMTDELITQLAKIRGLKVISHTSVERYKATNRSLTEIARELGVDAVVEGTVLRSRDRVRISAQLIDARSDQHLWAESYERGISDVLALQSEVAQHIATEVGVKLTPSDRASLANRAHVDAAAHEAYLRGTFYWNKLSCTGYKKALDYFQESIALDPTFAPAYNGISDSYFNLADARCWPQDDAFAKSKAAALKALELDPGSAQAHAQIGELAFYREWDWARAEKEFAQGMRLDPNDAGIHASYAIFLVSMSKAEQGMAEARKAHELDPVSEPTNMMFTYVFYLAHQYDECVDQAKKSVELYPGSTWTYYWIGQCDEAKGSSTEAVAAYLKAVGGFTKEVPLFRDAYERHGLPGFWEEYLQWWQRENKPLDPVLEAMLYSHMGKNDKALDLLNLGYQQHSDGLQFLKVEPVYFTLRNDPRFGNLLSRLGL